MKKISLMVMTIVLFSIQGVAQEVAVRKDTARTTKRTVIEIKNGVNPVIYIDGKKYDREIIDILDPDKIDRVDVFKGEAAMEKYNAENVICITTKNEARRQESQRIIIRSSEGFSTTSSAPVIIIDGTLSSREVFEKLSPDSIESITVLKGEEAKKQYKAESGAIIIKTKKQ